MISTAATHRAGTTPDPADRLRLFGLRRLEQRRPSPGALGPRLGRPRTLEHLHERQTLLGGRLGLDLDLHSPMVRVLLATRATLNPSIG